MENIALQSLQIFSLLRYARKLLPFLRPKVVAISVRNTIMRKFANFVMLNFFHTLQHFSTKFWDFTTFERLFNSFLRVLWFPPVETLGQDYTIKVSVITVGILHR